MFVLLFLSQGVPMISAGDEFGHSKKGNNNSWCQDNTLNWLNWGQAEKNSGLLRFVEQCIHLRKSYPIFSRTSFFTHTADAPCADTTPEIIWQSLTPCEQDWSSQCHTLAFLLNGNSMASGQDDHFLIMLNGDRDKDAIFTLPRIPQAPSTRHWRQILDTSQESPLDFPAPDQAPVKKPLTTIRVRAMGALVLQASSS